MVRHEINFSELWQKLPWKKLQRNLFRLQTRLFKAIRENDRVRAKNLQKLILKSSAARLLAVRQVTQLNAGKRTAGVDGQKSLNFKQRFALAKRLLTANKWNHSKLRAVPIPKKDGTTRMLKVPTMADRAWQCLVKYAIEPAHEALFHAKSYGFRPGRSTHDAQKILFNNLSSHANGINKRILELDIEKCFDRIDHTSIMERVIAPQAIKLGLWKCLKAGVGPEFPELRTPQGGVVSPLLANIALDGIEDLHNSIRYADDMVFILKPKDNAELILLRVEQFLAERGLKIKSSKTKLVHSTDGFDFLGWHFKVQQNGKFRCVPSEDNYKTFINKVKKIVNNSNIGARVKAEKIAPLVRGWRNYHRYCKMSGSRFSLWRTAYRAFKKFNKEKKLDRYKTRELLLKAFPSVPYAENRFVSVKGNKSPYDGDTVYWSKRNSKLYTDFTSRCLRRQNQSCGHCGLKFISDEKVQFHHIDGNHDNWRTQNLLAVHQSCHDYIHMGKTGKV
ncbi:reverse transcriptase domain-containing protein [Crocosphaera watsonii WH 8501]|uniref:RNA-directed DNA polymerase (Reverse transcriptase):HNH endonuclease n=5 Tax=Crocosphaera watsonii TaxID=263511 RepID=Q4BZK3_CROWT|nr:MULTISPECIES: reverse transcriptase domain-containing protein [Crocosphaera]EAM49338.1 RNA-directed DNA polymerase (Reverse transcriptase):HNH endonuclease [Crocosphaera watsonii WH 8501]EHJ11182.1 RNA-directed DNA polymerase (Reverse transcriptase):HNH endonuclease [Crocosphaera watsonii WH 0003]MCH2245062.1 reverse transcriptase N-terminal domain-containing protein [Crocosphaera sp.]NQZ62366.1 reverse transcriptase N-terminal domain-containing protein [Crocosphaera sp.]CCQ51313.1 RNA-dire